MQAEGFNQMTLNKSVSALILVLSSVDVSPQLQVVANTPTVNLDLNSIILPALPTIGDVNLQIKHKPYTVEHEGKSCPVGSRSSQSVRFSLLQEAGAVHLGLPNLGKQHTGSSELRGIDAAFQVVLLLTSPLESLEYHRFQSVEGPSRAIDDLLWLIGGACSREITVVGTSRSWADLLHGKGTLREC